MTTTLATVFAAPGAVTGYAAMAVAVLMLALWLASIPLRDVSIVDPAWGPAFVLVAAVAAVTGDGCLGRRWLLCGDDRGVGPASGGLPAGAQARATVLRTGATHRCASAVAPPSSLGAW